MILVTGATGNVGSKTIRLLAGANQQVRALVRDPAKATDLAGLADIVVGDLGSPRTLTAAFAGVDRVFVIAPVVPELATLEVNAFRAAADAGAKHVVKLSNFEAGTLPGSLWGWHEASENTLRKLGTPWTILRPTRFMTDTPFSWDSIVEHGTIVEPTGDGEVTVIDPLDVAAVAATVLTTAGHEGHIYYLTSADTLTAAQIAQKVAVAIGRTVTFTETAPEAQRDALIAAGLPKYLGDILVEYASFVQQGRMHVTTTVADLLGRPPRSYDEWLRDNAQARIQQAHQQVGHRR